MHYQIELHPHNGNVGENRVEPFAGQTIDTDTSAFDQELPMIQGRKFTLAFIRNEPEAKIGVYREKVVTKPSDWALAREAA